jgi:hypothetical protein
LPADGGIGVEEPVEDGIVRVVAGDHEPWRARGAGA